MTFANLAIVSSVVGSAKMDVTDVKRMFYHKWSLSNCACFNTPLLLYTPLSPMYREVDIIPVKVKPKKKHSHKVCIYVTHADKRYNVGHF